MSRTKKKVEVVAAIICHENKILCVQRGPNKLDYISHKYEFPGGKIEPGESIQETVVREIQEELNMSIVPVKKFITVNHDYPDFHLTMHSMICECEDKFLQLTEHIDYKWLSIDNLFGLDWAAADIPIVRELSKSNE